MATTLPLEAAAPPGYAVRRPTRADLPAIAELSAACDRYDMDGVDFTLATFELEWAMPRFDPTADAWMIDTVAGDLVGYTALSRRPKMPPEAMGWIHPSHRGRGIGSFMIDLSEARIRELAAEPGSDTPLTSVQWSNHAMTAKAELLTARGYRVTRNFLRMRIAFDDEEPPAPAWPDGVELRPMRVGVDDEAVYTTVRTSFEDHWGASPLPFDEWRKVHLESRLFDPSLWLLAWSGDRLVGVAINVDEDGEAWVQTLGVLREARGQGLGRALLLQSFGEFHARGHREIFLGVDAESLTGATRLYENAGMRADRQWDHWERELA